MRLAVPLALALWCASRLCAGPLTQTLNVTDSGLIDQLIARSKALQIVYQTAEPDSPIVGLFGDLGDANAKEADAIVQFAKDYGSLLGFPPGALPPELKVKVRPIEGTGTTYILTPAAGDLLWWGGCIGFHFTADHKLVAVTGRHRPMNVGAQAALDAGDAVKKALAAVQHKFPGHHIAGNGVIAEYLADAADGTLRPMYDLKVAVGGRATPVEVLLSESGEVVCIWDGGSNFDADGLIVDHYPAPADNVRAPIPKLKDANRSLPRWPLDGDLFTGSSSAYYQARSTQGHFDFPKDFVMTFDSGKTKRLSHPRYLETSMYHHLMVAHDKAVELGAKEVDEPYTDGDTKSVNTRFDPWRRPDYSRSSDGGSTVNNASFDWGTKTFYFDWYNKNYDFRQPAADPSVIYHEYGHYLHYRLNYHWDDSITSGELGDARAVSEGFADWFSMRVTGADTVAGVFFGASDARKPSLTPDYCHLQPIYDESQVAYCPRKTSGGTEIHAAGQLFSALCRELTVSGATQLAGDDRESVARLFESIRISYPTGFRTFALSVMAVEMRHGDGAKLPALVDLWDRAGLFHACPGK